MGIYPELDGSRAEDMYSKFEGHDCGFRWIKLRL